MRKNIKVMLIIEAIFIILLILMYCLINSNLINEISGCYINKMTGLKCPACGGTRCIASLLNLNFKASFNYHPVFFVSIVLGILINLYYIIFTLLDKKINIVKWWYLIIWLIVLIIYTILRNIC